MTEPATILFGSELITREDATQRLLTRLLGRLPSALWNTDPDDQTVQRDLAYAIAQQEALWLENRTTARNMTLLLEATGLDLDTLLQDYGLRRFLNRPDDFARQVGMHCLWVPKGTTHSVSVLADLLFDVPHTTLETGPNQVQVFVADTHPITTPYSYWGLISQEGLWYALTIQNGLACLSSTPPPGMNTAPGPHTLAWFTVLDDTQQPWYVTITGGTFQVSDVHPTWGYGTTEPFRVLDGVGGLWELRVVRNIATLTAQMVAGLTPYWRVMSADRGLYYVYLANGVVVITTTAPSAPDETPTTSNLDWFTVWDETDMPWYVTIAGDTLLLDRLQPTGNGTDTPFRALDSRGNFYALQVLSGPKALIAILLTPAATTLTVLNPEHRFEAIQLHDELAQSWWLSADRGIGELTSTLPAGATDVTPPGGPYRWLRLYNLHGQRWYGSPTSAGLWTVSTTSPGGLGTATSQTLGDTQGVQWHYGIDAAGTFAISNTPRRTFEGLSTALAMPDAFGTVWFWRLAGSLPWLEVSNVLWPDSIVQMPWGSIGWLRIVDDRGRTCYVYPDARIGFPAISLGPPLYGLGGWSDPILLYDTNGLAWQLGIVGGAVIVTSLLPDDLPQPPPVLSVREARDAFAHVQSAGSLVTIDIT